MVRAVDHDPGGCPLSNGRDSQTPGPGTRAEIGRLTRRRVLVGSASNFAGRVGTKIIWFVLTPFILAQLGPAGFGLWVLVGSFASYGYILDLGIANAVVKYVAEFEVRGAHEETADLVSAAAWLYLGLGAVAILFGVGVAIALPSGPVTSGADPNLIKLVVLLTAVSVGITIAATPTLAILQGLQRYDLVNLVNISGSLVTAAAVVVVLLAGGGLVGLVAISIPIAVATRIAALVLIRRVAPSIPLGWRRPRSAFVRRIFSFSSSTFGIQLAAPMKSESDEIVIGVFRPLTAVTTYALAGQISRIPITISETFLRVLIPLTSSLSAQNDEVRVRSLYLTSSRISLALYLPVAIVLVVLAEPALRAWVGSAQPESGALVLILSLSGLLLTSQYAAGNMLQGIAKHRRVAVAAILSGVANIARRSAVCAARMARVGGGTRPLGVAARHGAGSAGVHPCARVPRFASAGRWTCARMRRRGDRTALLVHLLGRRCIGQRTAGHRRARLVAARCARDLESVLLANRLGQAAGVS
jgi:O-antigen/teichoic acid export membrane protein